MKMSFLRKIAKDGLRNVAQNVSNAAQTKIGQAIAPQAPQQAPQTHQQAPQQAPQQAQQGMQPQAAQSGGVLEGALASLLGSAERFVDNAGKLISSTCPSCQTPGTANTACEKCGTQIPVPPALAANERPTNCGNCGAVAKDATCEYCGTRLW